MDPWHAAWCHLATLRSAAVPRLPAVPRRDARSVCLGMRMCARRRGRRRDDRSPRVRGEETGRAAGRECRADGGELQPPGPGLALVSKVRSARMRAPLSMFCARAPALIGLQSDLPWPAKPPRPTRVSATCAQPLAQTQAHGAAGGPCGDAHGHGAGTPLSGRAGARKSQAGPARYLACTTRCLSWMARRAAHLPSCSWQGAC